MLTKRSYPFQLFIVLFIVGNAAGASHFVVEECEDVRYARVRFGSSYTFFHELTNSSAEPVFMVEKQVRFIDSMGNVVAPGREYSLLQPGSPFGWSAELVDQKYAVFPNTTLVTVITGPDSWRINKLPQWRSNLENGEFDFMIKYQVTFTLGSKQDNRASRFVRTACNYYAISWCGDSSLDSNYLISENKVASEECDDGNQLNGDGCNSVCMIEY